MADIASLVTNLRDHANTPRSQRSEDRTDELLHYAADVIALLERSAGDAFRHKRALESIAANTCCDTCREAAFVARAALGAEPA
jgi:hypothetical protein